MLAKYEFSRLLCEIVASYVMQVTCLTPVHRTLENTCPLYLYYLVVSYTVAACSSYVGRFYTGSNSTVYRVWPYAQLLTANILYFLRCIIYLWNVADFFRVLSMWSNWTIKRRSQLHGPFTVHKFKKPLNPLERRGVRWLHFDVFSAIQVQGNVVWVL